MVKQKARTQPDAYDTNRNIDEENYAPNVLIDQPSAQDWTQGRRKDQDDAKITNCGALLFGSKCPIELGRAQWLSNAATKALHSPGDDQPSQRRCHAT